MKKIYLCIVSLITVSIQQLSAQCPDIYTDINSNNSVCGLYGDVNGNSNWNWEMTDKLNANYCKMWYARTSSVATKLTAMGSPFVDATTSALDQISVANDFTKTKGWELLRRDFGCSHVTAYPYFVLYNKYSGLMRIFVYQPDNQTQYSGILVQIEPTASPWPGTTAFGDEQAAAPDKFLSGNATGQYGSKVVAVSEPAGSSRWSTAEFMPAMDPNIANAAYAGKGLKFTIFGVTQFDMKAVLKGKTVSGTDPKVYNFNYNPSTNPTSPDNQTFSFAATGEKFIKFGKSITEVRDKTYAAASSVYSAFPSTGILESSLPGKIKSTAASVMLATQSGADLNALLGKAASTTSGAGNVLKFINTMIGLFGGLSTNPTPAPMPTYSSHQFELQGTLTAKNVQQTFILRIPGTQYGGSTTNLTYYQCPMGIFTINNTPQADSVVYDRMYQWGQEGEMILYVRRRKYMSMKLKTPINVTVNDGAGLELVSVEGAIIGEVLPDDNGNATYDILAPQVHTNPGTTWQDHVYNYTRADIESGILDFTMFDTEKKLHTFQTPYVPLACINGLAFNAQLETKVSLRIKAVLRKKNDPANTAIHFIQDYRIDFHQGTLTTEQRAGYKNIYGNRLVPYYSTATVPKYYSDLTAGPKTYTAYESVRADNSVTSSGTTVVNSGVTVEYEASDVILTPGFHATWGSTFNASTPAVGYALNCSPLSVTLASNPGSCYGIDYAQAILEEDPVTKLAPAVYPVPSKDQVTISGLSGNSCTVLVYDHSGRMVYAKDGQSINGNGTIILHLKQFTKGIYFVNVVTATGKITKKIVVL